MRQPSHLIASAALALWLAGCSSSGGSGFFSTGSTAPPAKPFFNDPDTRTTQVAWNSVRAQKCGFQIEPSKLKAGYLAWEAQLGTDQTVLVKLDGDYDRIRALVAERVAPQPVAEYCTDAQVAETRKFIQRYMAGDFSATPVAKRIIEEG
ncbi:MAG: hypothetical protein R3D57_07215 [Hyphomicrobiaceae bacterium]